MCGRFTLSADPEQISRAFGISTPPTYRPRYNIAPSQDILAMVHSHGQIRFDMLSWGLVPFWARDLQTVKRMINARAETLSTKKTFSTSFRKQRCLIVADGFYEWQKTGAKKTPYFIFLKSREPFGFAGIWSEVQIPAGGTLRSCAIVTTEANELLSPIDTRMPVILKHEDHAAWLAPDAADTEALTRMLKPFLADQMEYSQVGSWVNQPGHDGPECVRPSL